MWLDFSLYCCTEMRKPYDALYYYIVGETFVAYYYLVGLLSHPFDGPFTWLPLMSSRQNPIRVYSAVLKHKR